VLDDELYTALTALYDGGIRYVDDTLARWFDDWLARGRLDDTLLIVTADHGEALGQRGLVHGHGAPYQEGLRVPLLLRHPGGVRAGEREAVPVQLTDLVPTILAFAGLPPDAKLPGVALFGALPAQRTLLAIEPRAYDVVLEWPLKWTHQTIGQERWFAHDLEADPDELAPLPLDPLEFEARREAARLRYGKDHPRPVRATWTEEDRERMDALGYGGGQGDEDAEQGDARDGEGRDSD